MKTLSLTSVLAAFGTAAWVLMPVFDAAGQTTVATNPVGYLQTSCLSNSDTLVAPPFTRPAQFVGAVSSISGNVVNFSAGSLSADQFDAPTTTPFTKDTFYLSIGPATATLTGTVSVTPGMATVSGSGTTFGTDVKAGNRITINDGYSLQTYTVAAIGSATSLTLDRAFSDPAIPANSSVSASKQVATGRATAASFSNRATTASATPLGGLSATFDHSPYEGRFYQVISNTASSVTVNLNNDTLGAVTAGMQVSIIPYWTLNTIFNTVPPSTAGVNTNFTPTTSLFTLKTQVLVPDYASSGTNLSATAVYIYFTDGASNVGWRAVGDQTTDHGYDPMIPDGYITVRTPVSAPTLPVVFSGAVPVNKLVTMLATRSAGAQDNAVALNRPADATLGSLGLNPADGSFTATTSLFTLKDELFVYDNTAVAFNKSATSVYIYYNDGASNVGWRAVGDLTTDHGPDPIPAGSALTIRKAPTTTGQTVAWSNSPNY